MSRAELNLSESVQALRLSVQYLEASGLGMSIAIASAESPMASTAPSDTIKDTMKCASGSAFGDTDMLSVLEGQPQPPQPEPGELLVRVHACSLSPSDYRMLHGDCEFIKKPRLGFPYVPGGDVCGTVEAVPSVADCAFHVGDRVVSTWDVYGEGGIAELAIVATARTASLPAGVSAL